MIVVHQLPKNMQQVQQKILAGISILNLVLFIIFALVLEWDLIWVVILLPILSIIMYQVAKRIWIKPEDPGLVLKPDQLTLYQADGQVMEFSLEDLHRIDFMSRPAQGAYDQFLILTYRNGRRERHSINHLENFQTVSFKNKANELIGHQ